VADVYSLLDRDEHSSVPARLNLPKGCPNYVHRGPPVVGLFHGVLSSGPSFFFVGPGTYALLPGQIHQPDTVTSSLRSRYGEVRERWRQHSESSATGSSLTGSSAYEPTTPTRINSRIQWPYSMTVFPPGLSDPVHLSFNRKAQLMNEIVVKGA